MSSLIRLCLLMCLLTVGQLLSNKMNHFQPIISEENSCVCAGLFVVTTNDTFSQKNNCTTICHSTGFEAGLSIKDENNLFKRYLSQKNKAKSCGSAQANQVQVFIPKCEGLHSPNYGKRCALLYKSVCEHLSYKGSHQVKNNI